MTSEPRWLVWAREVQAIAQIGLTFSRDPYDRERYERLRAIAAEIVAKHVGLDAGHLESLFAAETGYATPKVDVRGAVFRDGCILLVREAADGGRWTLPGGWADVNESPAECVVREVREESGFDVRVGKLAAVLGSRAPCAPAALCLPHLEAVLRLRDRRRRGAHRNGDQRGRVLRRARRAG